MARAPISIRRTSIGDLYRVMPRQFGDGQHRQGAQHPPDTHGLLARTLFRAIRQNSPQARATYERLGRVVIYGYASTCGMLPSFIRRKSIASLVDSGPRRVTAASVSWNSPSPKKPRCAGRMVVRLYPGATLLRSQLLGISYQ